MKAFMGWIGAVVAVLFVTGTSHAIDVVNEDMRGYQVTMLLDSQARYAPMVRALNTLVSSGRRGDSLVFTFSGHGSWLPDDDGDDVDGRDEMLCPHDISTGGRARRARPTRSRCRPAWTLPLPCRRPPRS